MKYSIEFIRLLAVILITFTHTRHDFSEGLTYFFIEQLPQYGTVMLSVISGYLYWVVSRKKPGLFSKKVKTLLVPFLLANLLVLLPVLFLNYIFDYNVLNRLEYNSILITEGILSLNSPPINPPTYFIRDIFIVFVLIELFFRRNWYMLLLVLPLLYFGKIMLRYDILILFVFGAMYAKYEVYSVKKYSPILLGLISLGVFFLAPFYLKYAVSLFLFVIIIQLNFKFFDTGGYSYLLHLYHSPIMVISFPLISKFVENPLLNVFLQISISFIVVFLLFKLTIKFPKLKILSGNR